MTPTPPPATGTARPVGAADGDDVLPSIDGRRSGVRNAVEWVVIIALAVLAAVVIKSLLLQAFYIPSASMEPTLQISDRVLVNKLSYRLHAVHRGDIVVFTRPPAEQGGDPAIKDLIKRVIAEPGEMVEGRGTHVFIDGRQLQEPYLPPNDPTPDFAPVTVPAGQYWVMGDNRQNSKDSKYFGPIARKLLVGRAFVRFWPLTDLGLL